jgi:CRISPR system Cascade subunit CasE
MSEPLNLVRLVLDRKELLRVAARHRLPPDVDEGYLLHAGLAELFATSEEPAHVPFSSFAVDDTHWRAAEGAPAVYLLGYSKLDEAALIERLKARGDDRTRALVEVASQPAPEVRAGVRAAFRVRICPILRTKVPSPLARAGKVDSHPRREKMRKGTSRKVSGEVDAWVASRFDKWTEEPPRVESSPFERQSLEWLDRERVYGEWLSRELGRENGARLLEGTKLEAFRQVLMHRRGEPMHGERHRTPRRPDVIMTGELQVEDAAGFRRLLARGVGRHRAFGFGMLRIRGA